MTTTDQGYGIVTTDDERWTDANRVPMTDTLGCTHTSVDGFRTETGSVISLPRDLERVCVPVDADGTVDTNTGPWGVPRYGIVHVPAGLNADLSSEERTRWICVGATPTIDGVPDPRGDGEATPTVVKFDALSFRMPSTSDVPIARLTTELDCTGMKVNCRRLIPGSAVPYHTEGTQEELFVPMDGPGTLRVADERYELPAGSVARVAPETPRSAVNDGDEDRTWFMVGAPPTGGPDEWDPGAEILE